ncbi:DUF397 domain-containing protein [Actinocorallia sp. B10E7]|uniref:DUF397 domain-containing protein n=1 Tax=Actinocorallia sp. B10E7 TaxID=3153558 RepID=UPI00325F03EF
MNPRLSTLHWRRSSHSDGSGGECVEIAPVPGHVLVRDSKNPEGPVLAFRNTALGALLSELRTNGH